MDHQEQQGGLRPQCRLETSRNHASMAVLGVGEGHSDACDFQTVVEFHHAARQLAIGSGEDRRWCCHDATINASATASLSPEANGLVTTMDWIQWKTSSTLHSAFFKALRESTSMPTPSITP